MKHYLKLVRVKHYIKNLLIFAPLIFSGKLFDVPLLLRTCVAFVSFCLISSVVYIINDIKDVEKDRLHSTKRLRPIASGAVSTRAAIALVIVLTVVFVAILIYLMQFSLYALLLPLLYLVLNLAYSFGLKNQPIIDVTILAVGFVIRLLFGSAESGIVLSEWLSLTVIALSFYMGLGKRRNEIRREQDDTRNVLKRYTFEFLNSNMYLCLALAIVFYSLWTIDADTIARIGSQNLVWTVPFVLIICLKYSLDIERDSDGDPVEVVLKDKVLLGVILLFAVLTISIIYFGGRI